MDTIRDILVPNTSWPIPIRDLLVILTAGPFASYGRSRNGASHERPITKAEPGEPFLAAEQRYSSTSIYRPRRALYSPLKLFINYGPVAYWIIYFEKQACFFSTPGGGPFSP